MLTLVRRRVASQLPRYNGNRCFSEAVVENESAASTSSHPSATTPQTLPYFIPRNTKGNLPVYTDVRNAGGRYMVLVRNIEGNAGVLARDLSQSLFERNTVEASRLKVQVSQNKHIILSGGHWKNNVIEWLKSRGF